MIYLLDAIKTAFYANATLAAAFPGGGVGDRGIRLGEVPEGMAMPYVRVTPVTAPRTQVYSGAGFALPQLQFDVVAETVRAAKTAMLTFIGQWDTITLTLDSGAVFYGRRLNDPMPLPLADRDDDADDDVAAWSVSYEYANS